MLGVGGARGVEGVALCATLLAGGVEVPKVMRRVLLCMLEAVYGELCLLEELEEMFCMLEAVEGRLCSLDLLEVMRCMLRRMLDAVGRVGSISGFQNFHCGSFLVTVRNHRFSFERFNLSTSWVAYCEY